MLWAILGGGVYALVFLFILGLCNAAGRADEAMERARAERLSQDDVPLGEKRVGL